MIATASLCPLGRFVADSHRLIVLTGAGCSTDSGIPDYRDENGDWKHRRPVMFADFVADARTRQRYWARSLVGWRHFAAATPNRTHYALAALEAAGHVEMLVTQNVDGLHARAGSSRVVDLHGRLDQVICLDCHRRYPRARIQAALEDLNRDWTDYEAPAAPDGDARLERDCARFVVADCERCGGLLKPDVVFFGEAVPRERVARTVAALERADALLVVGSSLMVWSGLRFVRAAAARGIPRALVNLGRTRADAEFTLTVREPCAIALPRAAARLGCGDPTIAA